MSEVQVEEETKEQEEVTFFDMEAFLEKLEGNENPLTINLEGVEGVEVYKATAGQLFNIVDLIKHSLKTLGLTSFDSEKMQTFAINIQENPDVMFDTFLENFERGKKCVVGLCSLTSDEVDKLVISDLIALVTCEWRLNEDFFMKRISQIAKLIPVSGTGQ